MGVDWKDLQDIIFTLVIVENQNHPPLKWRWSASGLFTVKSLYQFLNFRGITLTQPMLWWNLKIPPKIKVFMWLVQKRKILTKSQLIKRGWTGPTHCHFCQEYETVNHLFIQCPWVRQLWFWFGQCQEEFSQWNSIQDIINFAYSLQIGRAHV